MKRISATLSVLAATLLIASMPALSDEGSMGGVGTMGEQAQSGQKDECLLVAMDCGNKVDSIQQRIDRLNKEISRGTDVYTQDELKRLERQLEDAQKSFDYIINNGGA